MRTQFKRIPQRHISHITLGSTLTFSSAAAAGGGGVVGEEECGNRCWSGGVDKLE